MLDRRTSRAVLGQRFALATCLRAQTMLLVIACASEPLPTAAGMSTHEGSVSGPKAGPVSTPTGASTGTATGAGGTVATATAGAGEVEPRTAGASGTAGSAQPVAGHAGNADRPGTAGVSAGQPAGTSGGMAMSTAGSSGSGAADGGSESEPFMLRALDVEMFSATEMQFPDSSLPPTNESPGFSWRGVPPGTKSLALTFTDTSGPAYKWIVWDIPPTTLGLPRAMSDTAMPSEVPGASQLGSLGNQGYAGPCCPANEYEFVLWALDVEKLPDAGRMSTAQIHNSVLPMHEIAKTPPVKMRRR